jgi:homoserine kinase
MQLNKHIQSVTAFAPATCANVAVGFDILGFPIDMLGDYVTLMRRNDDQLVIEKIESKDELPFDPNKNIAAAVVQKACTELNIKQGFSIHLRKEIALSSGMGGSAASAVAAIIAFNQFLMHPLSNADLIHYALYGEEIACGHGHVDNVIPALLSRPLFIKKTLMSLFFIQPEKFRYVKNIKLPAGEKMF